jgi:hypothetical protein
MAALASALLLMVGTFQPVAHADRWEVREEIWEGAHEVGRAKREARRELRRCETRECARREIIDGYREVQSEKREARREIRRAIRDRDDDRRDRGNDLLKGIAIGAAVIGITKAISDATRDDE